MMKFSLNIAVPKELSLFGTNSGVLIPISGCKDIGDKNSILLFEKNVNTVFKYLPYRFGGWY